MKTALVIMADGIGSRFGGGIKQLARTGFAAIDPTQIGLPRQYRTQTRHVAVIRCVQQQIQFGMALGLGQGHHRGHGGTSA